MLMFIGIMGLIILFLIGGYLGWHRYFRFISSISRDIDRELSDDGKLAKTLRDKALKTFNAPYNPLTVTANNSYNLLDDVAYWYTKRGKDNAFSIELAYRLALAEVLEARVKYPNANPQLFLEIGFWAVRKEDQGFYYTLDFYDDLIKNGCSMNSLEFCKKLLAWSDRNDGKIQRELWNQLVKHKKIFAM